MTKIPKDRYMSKIFFFSQFFETELTFEDSVENTGLFTNLTISYDVTDLRKNPNYIR